MRKRSRTKSTGFVSAARGGEILPALDDEYFGPLLDYAAEDRHLAAKG